MRGKSLILIVIALGCGLVASIGISQILDRQSSGGPKADMRKIYVAVRDVDINQVLDAEMIKLEEWPADKVQEGAITNLDEIKGMATNQRLFAGEIVRKEKLIDPNKRGGDSLRIPHGYRVQAIKVTADVVAGNLVKPGDHVDVIVYLRQSGNIQQTMTKTILQDVRVFAVNSTTTRETEDDDSPANAKTISLLLTPEQVETMLLASRLGQISLSLRRPDDNLPAVASEGKTPGDVLAGPAGQGTPKKDFFSSADAPPQAPKNNAAADFKEWLNGLSTQADPAAVAPEEVATRAWTVDVVLPDGVTSYEVNDDRKLSAPVIKNRDSSASPSSFGPMTTTAPQLYPTDPPVVPDAPPVADVPPTVSSDSTGDAGSTDGFDPDDNSGFDPGA